MFRSEEPFGVTAVVAYFACLSLTILLLSVPYFASYFINYYRKLHQIEEAIVRITEHQQISGLPIRSIESHEEHPPYSAVSSIEESIPGEEIALLKETSSLIPFGSVSETDSVASATHLSEKNRGSVTEGNHPTKTTEEEDLDRGQMSLLDDMFATEIPQEELIPETQLTEEEEPSIAPTTIQAYALLDPDCDLYIRGKSPFPEPKGVKMEKLDVGKYELILRDVTDPVSISFWMNNKKRCLNGEIKAEPGTVVECYPEFQEVY